ncbi:MAG: transporter substrate-binding domain-containing protein [Candidatus Dormibacteria bacterium]
MRRFPQASAAVVSLVLLTACSGGGPLARATPHPSPRASPLAPPAGLLVAGELTVASDPTYPPQEYLDKSGHFAGFDVDLLGAIGAELHVKVKFTNVNVDGIVPGFADRSRTYDMGISAQPETAALTGAAHTVEYLLSGQSVLVAAANPHRVKRMEDLCGLKAGANRGSSGEQLVLALSERPCSNRPVKYQPFDQDIDAIHAIQAGTLDAFVEDYPVASYFQQKVPGLALVPHQVETSADAMVFPLTDTTVYPAVALAFDRIRRNGVYRALLRKWGLQEGELK